MTKRIQLLIMAVLAVLNLQAKDSCRLKLTEAYITGGGYSAMSQRITHAQYSGYLPESKILKENYQGMVNHGIHMNTEAYMVNLILGFKVKPKDGPTLRMGLNIGGGSSIHGSYSKRETRRIDTLVSPRTGSTVYIDSVYNEYYDFNTRADLLQLDLSMIWRTRNPNNLTFYGGLGAFIGTSFNVFSEIRHYKYEYRQNETDENNYYYRSYGNDYSLDETESFKSANHLSFGAYVPIGVDLRLSKKKEFWKHFHLVFESRAQLQVYKFTGLSRDVNTVYNGLFGLRYKFD